MMMSICEYVDIMLLCCGDKHMSDCEFGHHHLRTGSNGRNLESVDFYGYYHKYVNSSPNLTFLGSF
jgi:hypothetical protein